MTEYPIFLKTIFMRKYRSIIILLSFIVLSAKSDVAYKIKMPSPEYPYKNIDLQNAIITTDSFGREVFSVRDLTYKGRSNPMISDIVLSFNDSSERLKKDDTGKYIISNASYTFLHGHGVLGGGGAGFFKNDDFVTIETAKDLWLGSCGDLGSFTLEFRFMPVAVNDNSVLFSRIGYFSGKKNGIEIKLAEGRIVVYLYSVFKDGNGIRYDVRLIKGRKPDSGEWHHFILSFDRISGKLAKYLDGFEDEVLYVTETDEPFEGVYEPSFECTDMPEAVIGKSFTGYIDEFRISYVNIDDLKKASGIVNGNYEKLRFENRIPVNQAGMVTSPVYDFPSSGTLVTMLKWSESLPDDTFVWMEFRISDSLFSADSNNLRWYRISNNQKDIFLMKDGGEFLRGKYYQWRAYLVPSPDGKSSPYLYDVELTCRLDLPPQKPLFVEVVNAGNKYVQLRWSKNIEHDIMGYRIYYGTRSGVYDGIISYVNGERITNDFNKNRSNIEVKISNDVIEENRGKDTKGVLDYPLLDNTVLYFFAVSAYDSYKPDTPYNHESLQSKEVKARPFAGSEIKM